MRTTLTDIRSHYKSVDTVITTLGGLSQLTLRITPPQILIINSKGNSMTLDQNTLNKVVARREWLASEKNMASRYYRPHWENAPAGQHTPSVPAVLRAMGL